MAELADAADSKSAVGKPACGFDPHSGHQGRRWRPGILRPSFSLVSCGAFAGMATAPWGMSDSGCTPERKSVPYALFHKAGQSVCPHLYGASAAVWSDNVCSPLHADAVSWMPAGAPGVFYGQGQSSAATYGREGVDDSQERWTSHQWRDHRQDLPSHRCRWLPAGALWHQ